MVKSPQTKIGDVIDESKCGTLSPCSTGSGEGGGGRWAPFLEEGLCQEEYFDSKCVPLIDTFRSPVLSRMLYSVHSGDILCALPRKQTSAAPRIVTWH